MFPLLPWGEIPQLSHVFSGSEKGDFNSLPKLQVYMEVKNCN